MPEWTRTTAAPGARSGPGCALRLWGRFWLRRPLVGTPVAGDDRGDRLVGTAALNYDMSAGGLDAGFSGIRNIDRGTAHSVEAVIFSDLEVGPDGTFARGQSGARIQGGFYGPDHAEAAGIFEQSDIVGAFGAKRQ